MRALPLLLATASAALLAGPLLRWLAAAGHVKENYRGRSLPCPFGVLPLAAALVALIPLALVQRLASTAVFEPHALTVALYAVGVAALGLIDDTLAAGGSGTAGRSGIDKPAVRGLREHAAGLARGELTTGALKAVGSLGIGLFALSYLEVSNARWLLATAVVVVATHAFNLLDLRPGRAIKALAVLAAGLTAGAGEVRTLWTLGLFAGPAFVAGGYDLRERAMLGDTGASLLGALAGMWVVLTLSEVGQALALAILLVIALYGEARSISALVERVPVLRELDSWGRPS